MRMSLRGIPAVFLLGMSLTGCGDLGNRPAPATVSPELPRVTVEVKGMS